MKKWAWSGSEPDRAFYCPQLIYLLLPNRNSLSIILVMKTNTETAMTHQVTATFASAHIAETARRLPELERTWRALNIPASRINNRVTFTCKDQVAIDAVMFRFTQRESLKALGFDVVQTPEAPVINVRDAQIADVLSACPITAEDYAAKIERPVGAVECGLDRLVADGTLVRSGEFYCDAMRIAA